MKKEEYFNQPIDPSMINHLSPEEKEDKWWQEDIIDKNIEKLELAGINKDEIYLNRLMVNPIEKIFWQLEKVAQAHAEKTNLLYDEYYPEKQANIIDIYRTFIKNFFNFILIAGQKMESMEEKDKENFWHDSVGRIAKIFDKYDELLMVCHDLETKLKLISNDSIIEKISEDDIKKIGREFLTRAEKLLTGYNRKTENETFIDSQNIICELDEIKAEMLLFSDTFKTLKQDGHEIEITDFNKIKIEKNSGQIIDEKDKQEMTKIAEANWADYKFGGEVVEEFKGSLNSSDNKFYIVKYDKDIIGFIRFDNIGNCELYSGSLNVKKDLRGSLIGETILKKMLEEEAAQNTIKAKAYSKLPITERYIGEFGFVADDLIEKYHGLENEFGFKLLRDDKKNNGYKYLNKSIEEIKKDYKGNSFNLEDAQILLKYNEAQISSSVSEIKYILTNGYVITGYKKDGEDIYLVLERKAADEIKKAA